MTWYDPEDEHDFTLDEQRVAGRVADAMWVIVVLLVTALVWWCTLQL